MSLTTITSLTIIYTVLEQPLNLSVDVVTLEQANITQDVILEPGELLTDFCLYVNASHPKLRLEYLPMKFSGLRYSLLGSFLFALTCNN